MADYLTELCHSNPLDPLPVWQNGTIGQCFNQLVLNALPHTLLAVSSACYLGTSRRDGFRVTPSCGWSCRICVSFLLALLFITDIGVVAFLHNSTLYLDILVNGIGTLAWLIHSIALLSLRKSAYGMTKGPATLLVLALLPVITLVITLISFCLDSNYTDIAHPLLLLRLVLVSVQLLLLLIYLVAFLVPSARQHHSHSVNDSDYAPLLLDACLRGPDGQIVAEDGSSWVSKLFYLWLNPLMKQGELQELNRSSDVYLLPRRLRVKTVRSHFDNCWEKCRQEKAALEESLVNNRTDVLGGRLQNGPRDRAREYTDEYQDEKQGHKVIDEPEIKLLSVLHKAFGLKYYMLGVIKLLGSMLGFAGPLLLNDLVTFMESGTAPVSHGVWCAIGLFASSFFGALLRNYFVFEVSKVALCARSAVISAIYRKALRVSSTTLARFTLGEVVNFMSTDTDRLVNFFQSFHEVWSLPFQFGITLYLLYLQVGVAFLGGLALALLLVPMNKVIANKIMENNKHMLRHKDTRVKLVTEVLFGIRVVKFYTWEKLFSEKISACRKLELARLKTIKYLDAVCVYTWAALPVVVSILTFITYVLLGHELTAAKVFTALALVGMLILPLNNFPWVLNGTLEAKVSLDRIQRFLQLSDQNLNAYYSLTIPDDPHAVIELKQSTFTWFVPRNRDLQETIAEDENHQGSLQLCNLNLTVKKGTFVAIIGKVGCGKSSLLSAITGELNRCEGVVYVQGRDQGFGLAVQEPWIQHATVRENILFGKEYNSRFYQAVIEACALTDDLNILPHRDQTEVGENGVTLSGGQKARLALARAVYMEKEIYLLDDPLAAVDCDVANFLLEKCILGILKHKTRILCTHRLEFLDKADVIVLMDDGKIAQIGTPSEILPIIEALPKTRKNDENMKEKDNTENDQEKDNSLDQDVTVSTCIGDEQKQMGAVALRVYKAYWLAVGSCLALFILLSLLLMQASRNISDWWLSNWIASLNHKSNISSEVLQVKLSPRLLLFCPGGLLYPVTIPEENTTLHTNTSDVKFYLIVYGSIAAANSVFTVIRAFSFAYGAICAATIIHDRLLSRVLKATMTFFDTTPLGRIVNRFSSDLYCVDDSLPFILNILLANVFGLLGMLIVISYGLPWILLVLFPLGILYYYIQRYYRQTSRELKRLYSLTLSPIYTQFSETLTGLTTIRASRAAPRFEQENENRLEANQRCLFASNAAMQWLDIRLQMLGVAVVTAISVIAVIQHQKKSVDPALVGLALSYALSVTNLLSGLISSFTQTETQMVSVERTEEYSTDIPTEPQEATLKAVPMWPSQGQIEFHGAVLVYRPGLPNALDGVDLVIHSGTKVGIVGRTGSGKSSMFLALFRMVELSGGEIFIDDINIGLISLEVLRSKLAIIPQDPFLFSGTIRENLDPWGHHSDAELFSVLEQCHLINVVTRMGGLGAEVGERGKTLSVGQRQLVCLARALLTQAKILCIDEATASVDQKTDKILQNTIREKFKEKTVLTIAHRLNTIMDYDKVLVMHLGKVVEFDSPAALCQEETSFFYKLVHSKTG
ncbi:multidrug resistance-associated protein 7 [Polypterus senegalus]|uniref:multidrug resistance-associated protein 7 n=1 Tax=Polypterus senegalus TaxID=55291 RepID=UPI0019630E63|nr:multidrug resistance-associated protein 7 [Polypterus senegalus]